MSAKFIYNLSDENPDLRKQIGCMNGILQLFGRHHFLGGSRRTGSQNQKRLPSGRNANHEFEPKSAIQKTTEKNHKAVKEKHRNSTESSRTSFSSSSCSSSLTSLECNRTSQQELSSSDQSIVPEYHAHDSTMYERHASLQSTQRSLDLRDVVKDSIHRKVHGLSVKTKAKGEAWNQTLKYIDSPRPVQHHKSDNSKDFGLKESIRVLNKLREGKHDSLTSAVDSPRFSCDGRESRATLKSTIKLKEPPRLSLDSRAGSMRSSATEMKSNYPLPITEMVNGISKNFLKQEETGSYKRPSGVVAKLMGLEALPESTPTNENQTGHVNTHPHEEIDTFTRSLRTVDLTKQKQFSGSPRNQHKEPMSPQLTNAELIRKPTACSKFPIEPAPWRQSDGSMITQIPVQKSRVTLTKAPNSSLSVYGEIEKRLAQLEFKRSGKDLRALKQILDAMQKTKEVLDTQNEVSNFVTWTNGDSNLDLSKEFANLQNTSNDSPISVPDKGTSSPKSFKSPIVIIQPAKLIGKASNSASVKTSDGLPRVNRLRTSVATVGKRTAKDVTPRTNHLRYPSSQSLPPLNKNSGATSTRLEQTSKKPQSTARESINSYKSGRTVNHRQQQKKVGSDKHAHPTTPLSDSNRTRRQPGRQPLDSGSPRGKQRAKSPKFHPGDDEFSDISTELRDFGHQSDSISLQSKSNISLASQADKDEVSSTDRSKGINSPLTQKAHWKQKNPVERSAKDKSVAEQPSPVSVLDATFYSDELPSPIKKISIAFKDDEALATDEAERNPLTANQSSCSMNSCLNSLIDHTNVEIIRLLMQNVMQLLSTHEEAITDQITLLYDNTNPDHQYISEILLASGLLKEFEFISKVLHPTAYPINPNLFLALEQAKASMSHSNDDHPAKPTALYQLEPLVKSRRKLIFDLVNEILATKLLMKSSSTGGPSPNMLGGQISHGQQLLGELCSEIDRLQGNNSNCSLNDEYDSLASIRRADLMHHSPSWQACNSEIPGIVLDVERSIFKDLITEVVNGEANAIQRQPAGYCRQLFSI